MTSAHSKQAFGLQILTPRHPHIRRLKQQYSGAELHGHKFWKSSYVLMDYLLEYPLQTESRILDLGCGWGLGGIFCARQFNASVVALDADDNVFPFLDCHAEHNGVTVDTIQMRFEDISVEDLQQFDAIIGADICFWDQLTPVLAKLLQKALAAEVPRIVLTDPGRPSFRALAESFAENMDCVYSDWAVPEPHNVWGLVLDI